MLTVVSILRGIFEARDQAHQGHPLATPQLRIKQHNNSRTHLQVDDEDRRYLGVLRVDALPLGGKSNLRPDVVQAAFGSADETEEEKEMNTWYRYAD